jgi:aryl-alcohol dehydrogenase-like predicted oxidoreductase
MLHKTFGHTNLAVSVLGFGAGHLGDDTLTDREAHDLLDRALELGISFFDTARSHGRSEERLGGWLPSHRDDVVLSTKVGTGVPGHPDWSAAAVRLGVEESLRTLQTEVIDVVFLHSCPLTALEKGEAIDALLACVDSGKVRVAGYSGDNEALAWAADSNGFGALQTSVNLADQNSLHEILPEAAHRGIGVVAKRPLANAPWRYSERPTGTYGETYWDRINQMGLEPAADDWPGTAVRFSAFAPGVSTMVMGTSNTAHLQEAAAAVARGPLPETELHRWEKAFTLHAQEWAGED